MDQLFITLTWIYYTCIFILPLAVDATGDPEFRSGFSSQGNNRCSFPEHWRGTWFQNGLGDLEIKRHSLSHIGHCVNRDERSNKYLLFKKKDMCFMCLAFTPQHTNLLQYKQSFCVRENKIDEVCSDITGDFILHTMVKVSGSPIPCPFQGHYSFSYTNGSDMQCDDPPSSIQACADSSKFLFNHRRCPKVANSFEKVESFQCLAIWDNGVDHYLYGRFIGPLLTSKESQYRCFMYSLYGTHGTMSMTADATCQGLQTPGLGMNVYSLQHKSEEWPQPRCQFPEFFTSNKHWRDIGGKRKYEISKREEVITVSDIPEPSFLTDEPKGDTETKLRISCISEIDSVENGKLKKVDMVVYVTDDKCVSSHRCIRLTQRTEGVVNIQIGQASEETEYLCKGAFFRDTEKHVLIPVPDGDGIPPKACPLPGRYNYVEPKSDCKGTLDVGCSRHNEMVVDAKCQGKESADVLQCYDTWTESDRVYLIAGRLGDLRQSADCLVYKVTPNGYQLEADPNCSDFRMQFMGKPISFVLDAPNKSCSMATTRPPAIVRPEKKKPIPDNGIYDTKHRPNINSADVLDTHHGGSQRTTSKYINQSCVRTHDKFLIAVSLYTVVVLFFLRR